MPAKPAKPSSSGMGEMMTRLRHLLYSEYQRTPLAYTNQLPRAADTFRAGERVYLVEKDGVWEGHKRNGAPDGQFTPVGTVLADTFPFGVLLAASAWAGEQVAHIFIVEDDR